MYFLDAQLVCINHSYCILTEPEQFSLAMCNACINSASQKQYYRDMIIVCDYHGNDF